MNSAISTVAVSTGSTHVAPRRYAVGGGGSNGQSSVLIERSRSVSDCSSAWLKPVPTPPANARAVLTGDRLADEQRPERAGSVAVAGGEPADRQVDAAAVLHLAPVLGPLAGPIGRAELLGDHAFEALDPCRLEQRLAVADAVRRDHPVVARFDELFEQAASILVRQVDRVGAADGQHVEQLQHGLPLRSDPAVLHELEARVAVVVEHDQLAVEDRVGSVDRRRRAGRTRASARSRRGRRCSAGGRAPSVTWTIVR